MKWKMILGVLCLLLIGLPVHAEEQTYIVKFNDSMQYYSSIEKSMSDRYCSATYDELQEYLGMGIVEFCEPDHTINMFEDYDSQVVDLSQWNLSEIKVEKAWNIGCYGNEIKVGVIDSGCYLHPDLKNNVLQGKNYTSDDETDTDDNMGHGTYVSGIIAAECNDAYMTGIAHQAKIVPLKCFDTNVETTTLMISNAIYDAIDIYDCDVINLSLGIPESLITKTLELSVKYAIQNGCIVVAAVGNKGNSKVYYPANYENVIGVGSVGGNNTLSWFSQRNDTVDVVAPGEAIESVSIDGYLMDSGTSFSAPHISAIAAIAKCINKNITPQEFEIILRETSFLDDNIDESIKLYYGYGLIDCKKIIDEMLKDTPYFISPITNKTAKIYNNSNSFLSAIGIVASYDNERFVNIIPYDIKLELGEITEISYSSTNELTKIMLWNSLSGLKPLHKAREHRLNTN